MSWTIVETKNAKYVLVFGVHDNWSSEVSPIKPDALVIETGEVKRGDFYEFLFQRQHGLLLNQAFQAKAEIWFTDVPPTEKSLRRGDMGKAGLKIFQGLAGISAAASYYALRQRREKKRASQEKRPPRKLTRRDLFRMAVFGGIGFLAPNRFLAFEQSHVRLHQSEIKNEKYWHLMTKLEDVVGGKGIMEIRNAITAEKSESFLAPRLNQKLNRKPVIVMVWGLGHYGVKELLEKPEKRRAILMKNKLEEFVEKGYPHSFRVKIPEKLSEKVEFEEFHETLKPRERPNPQASLNRREILRRAFGRRRMA